MLYHLKQLSIIVLFIAVISTFIITAVHLLFKFYPPALPANAMAVTVTDKNGIPLRSFPDDKGVWRYPVSLNDVSPLLIEALITYEDRYFFSHPGINPFSITRAFFQYIHARKPVTGGSTLSMQTARIFFPHSKTVTGKLYQMFRAMQLENRYSKNDILTLYLNFAPYGGPIEGVQAASYTYFGKPVKELSHAEAALLAVLPQAPSLYRPDRHVKKAVAARNKVLNRMKTYGRWDDKTIVQAMTEPLVIKQPIHSMTAPLLSRRLRLSGKNPVITTIDIRIQKTVSTILARHVKQLGNRVSGAVLVIDNADLSVSAYAGSADFLSENRAGHVDMVTAIRSPGSLLKPFLYAFAMEDGMIHSESLLLDAPYSFSGYRPMNFQNGFSGPVSASQALIRSLNIPAVDLLDRLGPAYFDARLRNGGLNLSYTGEPNLSIILGGVGTTLEQLVSAYTAFARGGLSGEPRYLADEPVKERRMCSEGAAYIIRKILSDQKRSDLPGGRVSLARSRKLSWKTGTSFGYRDAWAIGFTEGYTIGVWLGRPDGAPSPGSYGASTAAPLLFAVVDALPRIPSPQKEPPASVSRSTICWPLGTKPELTVGDFDNQTGNIDDPLCQEIKTAWILNNTIPPTLPDRYGNLYDSNPVTAYINPDSGLLVDASCTGVKHVKKVFALWPKGSLPWLERNRKALPDGSHSEKLVELPSFDPACGNTVSAKASSLHIVGIEPDSLIRPTADGSILPDIMLTALGGKGRLFWFIGDDLIGNTKIGEPLYHRFKGSGRFRLTVMDLAGSYDSIYITVETSTSG